MKALSTTISALLTVGALAFSAPSHAELATRIAVNHASAACMGSLHVDRDMTRARSAGLANVEAGVSDVKCGGSSTPLSSYNDVQVYEAAVRNDNAEAITLDCMLTDGLGEDVTGITTDFPRQQVIEAGQVGYFDWTSEDNNGSNFAYPSLSCQLPTGASVVYTAVIYQEEIGL